MLLLPNQTEKSQHFHADFLKFAEIMRNLLSLIKTFLLFLALLAIC